MLVLILMRVSLGFGLRFILKSKMILFNHICVCNHKNNGKDAIKPIDTYILGLGTLTRYYRDNNLSHADAVFIL